MAVKLLFGHAGNGSATAKMVIGDRVAVDFDYVDFVKYLFDNPDAEVITEIEESYNEEQQARLGVLVNKIEETAKGRVSQNTQTSAELGDIPF